MRISSSSSFALAAALVVSSSTSSLAAPAPAPSEGGMTASSSNHLIASRSGTVIHRAADQDLGESGYPHGSPKGDKVLFECKLLHKEEDYHPDSARDKPVTRREWMHDTPTNTPDMTTKDGKFLADLVKTIDDNSAKIMEFLGSSLDSQHSTVSQAPLLAGHVPVAGSSGSSVGSGTGTFSPHSYSAAPAPPSNPATGGSPPAPPSNPVTGGSAAGSNPATGGSPPAPPSNPATGGSTPGSNPATGGSPPGSNSATGGSATGSNPATGGSPLGSNPATGGSATGSNPATGRSPPGSNPASGGSPPGSNPATGGSAPTSSSGRPPGRFAGPDNDSTPSRPSSRASNASSSGDD